MKTVTAVVVLVFAGLLAVGLVPRLRQARTLTAEQTAVREAPSVAVVSVKRGDATSDLTLPGTLEALHEAPIYARTAGYVTEWSTDIGAHVVAGQLMAQIEAPELDRQAEQAHAALGQLKASVDMAKSDLGRWKQLARDSAVTAQELEQHQAAYDGAEANLEAGQDAYQRLQQLQKYEKVTAPFTGVVTSRSVDVGVLVSDGAAMGSTGASARPLFSVARTDTVRIYVNVPEDVLALVRPGEKADVSVQGVSNQVFHGQVTRNAHAVDAASRTLLTEVQIANPSGVLLPGMYGQVRFYIHRDHPPLVIPANALVVRSGTLQVGVIGPNSVVHFHPVQLGRDFGSSVEVLSGVDDGATLVVNPSDEVHDGSTVRELPNVKETTG